MAATSTRPELACEIVPEGVIAARRQAGGQALAAASFVAFGPGAPAGTFAPYLDKDAPRVGLPGVQTGGAAERDAVVAAMRRALENVGGRNGVLTLVVPDTAVRVLILDFDSLPAKAADAIPLLRFRLKKMVPFDVDDAQVSYQQLAAATGGRAVVAVVPNPVLREYEAVVREAGFEPGIVLPSTLACLGMVDGDQAALLVHCNTQSVTTAIVNRDELLLHRTQELPWSQQRLEETMNPAEAASAMEEAMPQSGGGEQAAEVRRPSDAATVTADEFVTNVELSRELDAARYPEVYGEAAASAHAGPPAYDAPAYDAPAPDAPAYDAPAPDAPAYGPPASLALVPGSEAHEEALVRAVENNAVHQEMQHALAVAAAYFEDALGRAPAPVLVAGAVDSRTWQTIQGDEFVTLRDLVALEDLGTAMDAGLSRAQLGAVCGALRG